MSVLIIRTCAWCGAVFYAPQSNYKFCSKECAANAHREKCKEQFRKRYKEMREQELARNRKYYRENREKAFARFAKYRAEHPNWRKKRGAQNDE